MCGLAWHREPGSPGGDVQAKERSAFCTRPIGTHAWHGSSSLLTGMGGRGPLHEAVRLYEQAGDLISSGTVVVSGCPS